MTKTILHPTLGEITLSRTRRAVRIALSVRPNGSVRLSFPSWVTQGRALRFLEEKHDWVAENRRKMAEKYPSAATPLSQPSKELRDEAKVVIPQMVARLADLHGFKFGAVRIKNTRSRWGSCTAKNDINLSISLMHLPSHLAEYIVLHELCHTVHKNHSARFHALLDRVTGGRDKSLSRELRSYRPGI